MTILTQDGLQIDPQDLSGASPTSEDHYRLYAHDGSSDITLSTGETFSKKGYYFWDNDNSGWNPMKNTVDDADLLGGNSASYYAADADLSDHVEDMLNPHGVTATQVGGIENVSGSVDESHLSFDTATQAEVDSHTETTDAHHVRYADSEAVSAVTDSTLPGDLTMDGDGWVKGRLDVGGVSVFGGGFVSYGNMNLDGNQITKAKTIKATSDTPLSIYTNQTGGREIVFRFGDTGASIGRFNDDGNLTIGGEIAATQTWTDSNYYDTTEADSRFLEAGGDTLQGSIDANGNAIFDLESLVSDEITVRPDGEDADFNLSAKPGYDATFKYVSAGTDMWSLHFREETGDFEYYNYQTSSQVLRIDSETNGVFFPSGDLTVEGGSVTISGEPAATQTWVNNNADVPNADAVDGYDIQKDGTDGEGIINFKTS